MPRFRPRARHLLEGALVAVAVATASCLPMDVVPEGACEDGCKAKAKVCEKPSVMALARDLDALEAHLERYGSVVVKQPDVWGQARLTKHREEFEKEMEKQLGAFQETLQGSL